MNLRVKIDPEFIPYYVVCTDSNMAVVDLTEGRVYQVLGEPEDKYFLLVNDNDKLGAYFMNRFVKVEVGQIHGI